ncbi:hypothetical protein ACOME3_008860 [Neoechinorhynchus agilis]
MECQKHEIKRVVNIRDTCADKVLADRARISLLNERFENSRLGSLASRRRSKGTWNRDLFTDSHILMESRKSTEHVAATERCSSGQLTNDNHDKNLFMIDSDDFDLFSMNDHRCGTSEDSNFVERDSTHMTNNY